MAVFESPVFDDHELVSFVCDPDAGLRAIIAIHWGGPIGTAGGGCRIYPYPSEAAALRDVLRLSRAMSYKLALTNLPGGGAKSVILADPRTQKTPELLRAFGRAIEGLAGKYIVAEDVGSTPADMELIASETDFVVGRASDTSPATGFGTFVGLEAAVKHALRRNDLGGLKVAVQGVGGVGFHLGRELARVGAKVWVSDPDDAACERAVDEFGATRVELDAIYDLDVDVFSPCAMGDVLDDATIPRLKAKVVAGGANNQLRDEARHAAALAERGIFYAPDFVLNAGGVIAASIEVNSFEGEGENVDLFAVACERTRIIADLVDEIVALSASASITTHAAAVRLAKARIEEAKG